MGVLVAGLASAAAWAQDRTAIDKVTNLNKKALDAYENLDFEEARKLLVQALEVSTNSGMDQHKLKARTHVHLGIVLVAGFKQRELGMKQFRRAFEIQPDIALNKNLANPEIQAAFDDAKPAGGGGAEATEPAPPPALAPPSATAPSDTPPADVSGLYHDLVVEGYRNKPVMIRVAIGKDLEFDRVVLAYRPKGATEYLARDMAKDSKGWMAAEIPAAATGGDVVEYYIEARNKAGMPLQANGAAREPNIVALVEAPPPPKVTVSKRREGDEDEGRPRRRRDADEDADDEESSRSLLLAFGLGGGAGWAQGRPELNPVDASNKEISILPGLAPAMLMHVLPEIGFYLGPDFTLSLQARMQWVRGATPAMALNCPGGDASKGKVGQCIPAAGALAVFARATWLYGESTFHPYFSLSVGGGTIRHLVNLAPAVVDGCGSMTQPCFDTVKGGMFLAGPGLGFWLDMTDAVSLTLGLNTQLGVPNFTVNGDVNVGMAIGM